jgi:hypothetical protein
MKIIETLKLCLGGLIAATGLLFLLIGLWLLENKEDDWYKDTENDDW